MYIIQKNHVTLCKILKLSTISIKSITSIRDIKRSMLLSVLYNRSKFVTIITKKNFNVTNLYLFETATYIL